MEPGYHLNEDGNFVLTDDVKSDFNKNGYILVRGLLSNAEVAQVKKVLEVSDILKHQYGRLDKDGKAPQLILWQHPGNDVTGMVARCEKVVNTCEELLGGEVYHYHTKLNTKEPNIGGKFEWHQDYGYWYKYGCLLPDMMTSFIALDRCDRNNGCLQVLKGSHRFGRIDHGIIAEQTGADMERVELLRKRCELVHVELEPGDAIFFHCNVLHTSGENTSDTWRRAFLIAYNKASNNPIAHIKHPQYTPLQKVPNTAIMECTNFTDFTGKQFYKSAPQI